MRLGRQTPTSSVVLPYEKSFGQDAIDLYNNIRTAQEWQRLLVTDILAYGDDNLWVHSKFGYSVPRRNGKNEIVAIVWSCSTASALIIFEPSAPTGAFPLRKPPRKTENGSKPDKRAGTSMRRRSALTRADGPTILSVIPVLPIRSKRRNA